MKNFRLIIIALLLFSCVSTPVENDAIIHFENLEHDFGIIPLNKVAEYSFLFSNSVKTPLIISDVQTSCGCTVPEWPKEPIKSGKNGIIKVKYDSAHPGVFHKTITIYYNGAGSPDTLTIKGEVAPPQGL